ncbi:MAG: serine/threonine protein kinase, partial [Sciscionella sp.]|nr:serine/threonine protein kinase [Sciscionella sp.]
MAQHDDQRGGTAGTTPANANLLAGRYLMRQQVGSGGMGAVWLAEDTVIGRRVAIKEVRLPDGLPDAERAVFSERVLREARTAGRLTDAGIVTVYDVVFSGGLSYIVMEYVESRTLSEIVRDDGPLPARRVAEIAGQVLAALDAAHEAGVVHRDVKPSNILVQANGKVKLTDFGIAQAMDDPRLTTTGTLVGSPAFMAPERISDGSERSVTPASDLWSLGATLFHAVEGYPPFERANTAATLHAIMTEVPYLSNCSGPLAAVIIGLLNANPSGRLTSAQVRGLLARVSDQPTAATANTATPASGTVAPTMVAGSIGHPPTALYDRPPGALIAPEVKRRNRKRTGVLIAVVALLAAGAFVGGLFTGKSVGASQGVPSNWVAPLTYGSGGDIPDFELDQGKCGSGQVQAGRRFTSESAIDCGQPHDFEVYSSSDTFDTSEHIDYPGYDALAAYAQSWCSLDFNSKWVTEQDKDSALKYTAVVPSQGSWGSNQPTSSPSDGSSDSSGASDSASQPTTTDTQNLNRTVYCILFRTDSGQMSQ